MVNHTPVEKLKKGQPMVDTQAHRKPVAFGWCESIGAKGPGLEAASAEVAQMRSYDLLSRAQTKSPAGLGPADNSNAHAPGHQTQHPRAANRQNKNAAPG